MNKEVKSGDYDNDEGSDKRLIVGDKRIVYGTCLCELIDERIQRPKV